VKRLISSQSLQGTEFTVCRRLGGFPRIKMENNRKKASAEDRQTQKRAKKLWAKIAFFRSLLFAPKKRLRRGCAPSKGML
jgi:hypothetical protein